jgi:hypothetical protein
MDTQESSSSSLRTLVDVNRLRDVLCWASQMFSGWRPSADWTAWDEEVAQAVSAIQRELETVAKPPQAVDRAAWIEGAQACMQRTGGHGPCGVCKTCRANHQLAALLSPVAVEETHEDTNTRTGDDGLSTSSRTASTNTKGL